MTLLLPLFGYGQEFDEEKSTLTFDIKNAGFKVDGSFEDFAVVPLLNPDNLSNSSVTVRIFTKSINTDNGARDKHLRNDDYFDVATFPEIRFESKRIWKEDDHYKVRGNLTVKDEVRDVEFPFSWEQRPDRWIIEGTLSLSRLDFGVGGKSWLLSNTVNMQFHCEFTPRNN